MRPAIVVHTRPSCLFCSQVIDLLTQSGIPFTQREIVDRKEQDNLTAEHQTRAFPIVTAGGKYVGGYAQIVQLHATGRLGQLTGGAPDEVPREVESRPPSRTSTPPRPVSGFGNMARLYKAMKDDAEKD